MESKFQVALSLLITTIFAFLFLRMFFEPTGIVTCNEVTLVDKRFAGWKNDTPTFYVMEDEAIQEEIVSVDDYYNFEVGQKLNYCIHIGKYTHLINFRSMERIER